jgi:hypothetical protein
MLTVAASEQSDRLASFSNHGYSVHLAAPGKGIISTVPPKPGDDTPTYYGKKDGTSMAAPFVTGVAALLKAANPALDAKAIKNLLLAGADPVPGLKTETMLGARLNAANSLQCTDRSVLSPVKVPPASLQAGAPLTLSALSIRCADPRGPVTAELSTGEVIELKDDGVVPDLAAGDGLFSASWIPKASGSAAMVRLFSPIFLSEGVPGYWPLSIKDSSLPEFIEGASYEYKLVSSGGVPPYQWSVAAGTLPSGVVLQPEGVLHGTPAATGVFSFSIQESDSDGNVATREFTVAVKAPGATSAVASAGGGGGGGGGGCFIGAAAEGRGFPVWAFGPALLAPLALRRFRTARRRVSA